MGPANKERVFIAPTRHVSTEHYEKRSSSMRCPSTQHTSRYGGLWVGGAVKPAPRYPSLRRVRWRCFLFRRTSDIQHDIKAGPCQPSFGVEQPSVSGSESW
jgi:hypothetical protein